MHESESCPRVCQAVLLMSSMGDDGQGAKAGRCPFCDVRASHCASHGVRARAAVPPAAVAVVVAAAAVVDVAEC